jgi:hypothetical protein
VTVPPVLPLDVPLELVDDDADAALELELDELPHAANANAAVATMTAAHSGPLYFLMRPPPRGLSAEI